MWYFREERKEPIPTPHIIEKFNDQIFSDFESNQSLNDDQITPRKTTDQPSISRRSKAERKKIKNAKQIEQERNLNDDQKLVNKKANTNSTVSNSFWEKVQSKDFSKTMSSSSNKQGKLKEEKGSSNGQDQFNQSFKNKVPNTLTS